jgi:hypothetical protein
MESYNPLNLRNIAETLVRELLRREPGPLPPSDTFDGAGVYAIYYMGDFHLYRPLSGLSCGECRHPIYVGRAAPPGARKGGMLSDVPQRALFARLREHARSVDEARNLSRQDFRCSYLVTDELWLALAERLLIERYRPVWNVVVSGFGNHDPGGGRAKGRRSDWDTLHPGRRWAESAVPASKSVERTEEAVRAHLRSWRSGRRE